MTIETTVFTFKLLNTFEEWVKMFDSPEIDAFHKTVGITLLYPNFVLKILYGNRVSNYLYGFK